MYTIDNKEDLENTIRLINDSYLKLTTLFYKGILNNLKLNKLELKNIGNNKEFFVQAINYINYMSKNKFNDNNMMLIYNKKINSRVKTISSLYEKINQYLNSKTEGKVIINKSINDLVGFRLLFELFEIIKK